MGRGWGRKGEFFFLAHPVAYRPPPSSILSLTEAMGQALGEG